MSTPPNLGPLTGAALFLLQAWPPARTTTKSQHCCVALVCDRQWLDRPRARAYASEVEPFRFA